jgi:hypothetical protein
VRKDRVEDILGHADEAVEDWMRNAAGVLRHQLKELQVHLDRLGAHLAKLEGRRPTPRRRAVKAGSRSRSTRPRKKAA